MKITTIGKGNIGGGLARLWEKAGHEVTTLGHEGGDASGPTSSSSPFPVARLRTRSGR
jgi:predicted dinucleotide-binding enzyme